jgi:hypothetical protein
MVRVDVSCERTERALGMRMLTLGVCSKESGIERRSIFMTLSEHLA